MRKQIGLRWTVWVVAAAMLTVLVAACGETVVKEVPVEKIVEKVVTEEVVVEVERVVEVEKEVVKEVVREVPVEVVKEVEVIKEVPKVITEEKVVVREIERIVVATPAPVGAQQFLMMTNDPFPKRGGPARAGCPRPPLPLRHLWLRHHSEPRVPGGHVRRPAAAGPSYASDPHNPGPGLPVGDLLGSPDIHLRPAGRGSSSMMGPISRRPTSRPRTSAS